MILNKLNQYKNLYLQASNENAHLKHGKYSVNAVLCA